MTFCLSMEQHAKTSDLVSLQNKEKGKKEINK